MAKEKTRLCTPSGEALELLKMYNREDTVNLFDIAGIVYERLRAQTGIEEFLSIPSRDERTIADQIRTALHLRKLCGSR
jgi:hypothetical protein